MTITGGKVNAHTYRSGGGAGIGGGSDGEQGGAVRICGGEVNAKGYGGAGIGGGSEKDGCDVEITGGTVTAESVGYAAGIGGGSGAKNGTITITGSFEEDQSITDVTAISFRGAGIGCGWGSENHQNNDIIIDSAAVKAVAKEGYAAGIGAGGGDRAGGNGGRIIIRNAVVWAGSQKGAGIGGGGCGDGRLGSKAGHGGHGGEITIDNSAIFAVSSQRGAGIGGGEGGDGGQIAISDSYVEAVGGYQSYNYMKDGRTESRTTYQSFPHGSVFDDFLDQYYERIADIIMDWLYSGEFGGAGIGGGDKGKGGFVEIFGSSVVLATGGMNTTSAIGYGNSENAPGTIFFPDWAKVKAGSEYKDIKEVDHELRQRACYQNRCALIETCDHSKTEYQCIDEHEHVKICSYCKTVLDDPEAHEWNETMTCIKCGAQQEKLTVTIIQQGWDTSTVQSTEEVYRLAKYNLPESTEAPDDKEFVCWVIDDGVYGSPGDDFYPESDMTLTAVYADLAETDYINEQGVECTVLARRMTADIGLLTPGWYVADSGVIMDNLRITGNVNLIVADNPNSSTNNHFLDVKNSLTGDTQPGNTLTLYGQKKQNGFLQFEKTASLDKVFQYGGKLLGYGGVAGGGQRTLNVNELTLARGSLDITILNAGTINLSGGKSEIGHLTAKQAVLGWTTLSDSIYMAIIDMEDGGSMRVVDGKSLKDENTEIYAGVLSAAQINTAQMKTLTPYHPSHGYGDPEWEWADDCSTATAVFTCKDCGHREEVQAVVARDTKDSEPVYKATAVLDDETYIGYTAANYFVYRSLSLQGDIAVNFYLYIPEELRSEKTEVVFAWDGNKMDSTKKEMVVPWNEFIANDGLYKFSCNVCAAEMSDEITAELYHDGKLLETNVFSVKEYAKIILYSDDWIADYIAKTSQAKYDALAILVKSMLNYGANSQTQFGHHTDEPANEGVGYPLDYLTREEITGIAGDIPDNAVFSTALEGTRLEYYGYSLLLKTKTALRFYFRTKADDPDLSSLSLGGENIVQRYNDKFVYIEMVGISAKDLENTMMLQYAGTPMGEYSALSYVKDVLTNASSDQTIIDTVTALYRYNKAAVMFFSTPANEGGGE